MRIGNWSRTASHIVCSPGQRKNNACSSCTGPKNEGGQTCAQILFDSKCKVFFLCKHVQAFCFSLRSWIHHLFVSHSTSWYLQLQICSFHPWGMHYTAWSQHRELRTAADLRPRHNFPTEKKTFLLAWDDQAGRHLPFLNMLLLEGTKAVIAAHPDLRRCIVTLSLCLDQENQDQNKALCDCDLDACEVFGFACSRFLPQGLDSTLQERRWHFSFRPLPSKYIQATCTFCFSQQDCPSEYCAVPDCTDHRSMEFLEWTFSEDHVGSTRRGLFIEEAC